MCISARCIKWSDVLGPTCISVSCVDQACMCGIWLHEIESLDQSYLYSRCWLYKTDGVDQAYIHSSGNAKQTAYGMTCTIGLTTTTACTTGISVTTQTTPISQSFRNDVTAIGHRSYR